MIFLVLCYAFMLIIPGAIMHWRGKLYAARDATTMSGAFARALSWSLVTCWTVMLIYGGMVPGIIPVPWWAGAIYSFVETDSARGIHYLFTPHLWLTPAVPIAVYLLSFKLSRRQDETQVTDHAQ